MAKRGRPKKPIKKEDVVIEKNNNPSKTEILSYGLKFKLDNPLLSTKTLVMQLQHKYDLAQRQAYVYKDEINELYNQYYKEKHEELCDLMDNQLQYITQHAIGKGEFIASVKAIEIRAKLAGIIEKTTMDKIKVDVPKIEVSFTKGEHRDEVLPEAISGAEQSS